MAEESYIRGAAPTGADPRRVGWVLAVLVVVALAGGAIGFGLSAASNDATTSRLRQHGQPVSVTVTACSGISSGIGMGIEFYDCSGRYALGGQTFVEPIRGSRSKLETGQVVQALAIPGDPSSLAVPGSVHSSATGLWVAAATLGACSLLSGALLAAVRRRGRGTRARSGSAPVQK